MKKRTRVPFYGKRHQRMEARAASLTGRGLPDEATELRKSISADLKKRRGAA